MSRGKVCHIRRNESAQMEVAVVVERPAKQGIGTMRAIPERKMSQSGVLTSLRRLFAKTQINK